MNKLEKLQRLLDENFTEVMISHTLANGEITIEVSAESLVTVCQRLRDHEDLRFACLMDICGVDYLTYGVDDWQTQTATSTGFDRAVISPDRQAQSTWKKPRFAVVYHLLSIIHNWRLRVRTFAVGEPLMVDSVVDVWQSANWFEREAFDLFGIYFKGHPDLRRILTDYGFVGHPMCKDFPLVGKVEVRYDHAQTRVVNQPVSIEPRTLVPRVIRKDNRYIDTTVPQQVNDA